MKIIELNTGYCLGSNKIACKSKKRNKVRFLSRAFIIQTKKYGNILFDTGYEEAYHANILAPYDWILPAKFSTKDSVIYQLGALGLSLVDISYIFISHFHVDHIAGLKSLPGIPWIYRKDALNDLLACNPLKRWGHGFFKGLVPSVPPGSIPIDASDFKNGFKGSELKSVSLFNEPQIEAVNLPGHALGQMGLCMGDTFFIADAAWTEESLAHGVMPSTLGLLLQHDKTAYLHTFDQIRKIQEKNSELKCIPTHKVEVL